MAWLILPTGAEKAKLYTMYRNAKAFTIVELLIVIVIIAVLATISVFVYSGMQVRAKNTAQSTAAAAYIRLLRLYKIQNGTWPTGPGCLGGNNIDTDSDGIADCGDNAATKVNPTLLAQLKTVGTLPDVVTDQIEGTSGTKSAGIRYWGVQVDGTVLFTWYVRGSATACNPPSGIVYSFISGNDGQRGWCQLKMIGDADS